MPGESQTHRAVALERNRHPLGRRHLLKCRHDLRLK